MRDEIKRSLRLGGFGEDRMSSPHVHEGEDSPTANLLKRLKTGAREKDSGKDQFKEKEDFLEAR